MDFLSPYGMLSYQIQEIAQSAWLVLLGCFGDYPARKGPSIHSLICMVAVLRGALQGRALVSQSQVLSEIPDELLTPSLSPTAVTVADSI